MTVLDIGCYDGWITNELQRRLGFEEAIGVEPRKKNIDKGVVAREALSIETECTFIQGSLSQLKDFYLIHFQFLFSFLDPLSQRQKKLKL
mgnify:CR=1 FL=1